MQLFPQALLHYPLLPPHPRVELLLVLDDIAVDTQDYAGTAHSTRGSRHEGRWGVRQFLGKGLGCMARRINSDKVRGNDESYMRGG